MPITVGGLMPHRVEITVFDDDKDAEAIRRRGQITAYLSYLVPLWARDAAVAHLTRSLHAVDGELATVHLDRGQAILVALDSARPRPRARPRIRIDRVPVAATLMVLPLTLGLLAVNQAWIPRYSIETPRTTAVPDPLICPPAQPDGPPAPQRGTFEPRVRPPADNDHRTRDRPIPHGVMPALPGLPSPAPPPTITRQPPRYLPDGMPDGGSTDPYQRWHPSKRREQQPSWPAPHFP